MIEVEDDVKTFGVYLPGAAPKPFPWWLFGLLAAIFGVPIAYFLARKPKK